MEKCDYYPMTTVYYNSTMREVDLSDQKISVYELEISK